MTVTFSRGPVGFVKHGNKGDPGYQALHPNAPTPRKPRRSLRPARRAAPAPDAIAAPRYPNPADTKRAINQRLAEGLLKRTATDPDLAEWVDAHATRLGYDDEAGLLRGWANMAGPPLASLEAFKAAHDKWRRDLRVWRKTQENEAMQDGDDRELWGDWTVAEKLGKRWHLSVEGDPASATYTPTVEDLMAGDMEWGDLGVPPLSRDMARRVVANPPPREPMVTDSTFGQPVEQLPGLPTSPATRRYVALRQAVRTYIDTWAASSGDSEPSSIALQRAAHHRFGTPDSAIAPLRQFADSFDGVEWEGGSYDDYGDDPEETTTPWALSSEYLDADGPFLEHFVEQMYDDTQAELAAAGVTEVTIHRGMKFRASYPTVGAHTFHDTLPEWARPPADYVRDDLRTDDGVVVAAKVGTVLEDRPATLQPLSSWSTDPNTATGFAGGTGTFHGVVLSSTVPADRIFSLSTATGVGCVNEKEIVVLGGDGEVEVDWRGWGEFTAVGALADWYRERTKDVTSDRDRAFRTRKARGTVCRPDDDWRQADWIKQVAEDVDQDGVTIPANVNRVSPPDGPVRFVKHGTKGRPGYRRLHGDAREVGAGVARRLRQAGQPDLFNQPPDPEPTRTAPPARSSIPNLPPLEPTTRRGQWAEQAAIPPPPFDPEPTTIQSLDARRRAMRKWLKANGRYPTRMESRTIYDEAVAALRAGYRPFPKGTEAAIRRAWNDVIGAHPSLARYVAAIRPPSRRMGRGVLGRTMTGFPSDFGPWKSDIELRKTMPTGLEDLPNNGGSTPGWDRKRVAEAVATHELAHVLWYKAMREHRVADGRASALSLSRQRPPDDVPSPTVYGTEDAAEHFAEVFTVTRMFRDPKYRYLTSGIPEDDLPDPDVVLARHNDRLAAWDRYVADVVAGWFPKPGKPPPPRLLSPEITGAPGFRWRTPDGLPPEPYRKAAMTIELDVHDDDFFGHLTDAELDAIGLGDWADGEDDDDRVVFVQGPHGFTKAVRRPWREELHPRGWGGRFGRGTGQRRHAGDVLDRPSGLGRRDRPPAKPKVRLGLQDFPAHRIHAGNNDRKTFDPVELKELADSIAQDGIAFPPLVRPHPTIPGDVEIVGGERRVRAMRDLLGWEKIPVKVEDLDDEQASILMLVENRNRVDPDPVDEAIGYQDRMARFGWTAEELSARSKVPVRRIKERLDLLALQPKIQDLVNSGQFPIGHARLMRDLEPARQDIAMQRYNAGTAGGGTMTVATFRQVVAKLQNDQDQQGFGFDMDSFMQNEDVDAARRAAEEAKAAALAAKRAKNREAPLGATEIAERYGVKPATVQQWKSRKHLPPPDGMLSRTIPYWYESTLEGWKPPGRIRKMFARVGGYFAEVD